MTEVCIEILNQRWTAWVCELSGIFTKCCVHLQHLKEGSKISLGSQSEPWPKKAVDSLFEKAPVRQTEWAEPNFDSAPRVAPIFPYLEFHSKVCSTHFCCAYHVPEWMKARAENRYKIWSQKMRQTWHKRPHKAKPNQIRFTRQCLLLVSDDGSWPVPLEIRIQTNFSWNKPLKPFSFPWVQPTQEDKSLWSLRIKFTSHVCRYSHS